MAHILPPLPYPTNALEPYIDALTMEIHHGRHHRAYVDNLNNALEGYPELQKEPIEQLLRQIDRVPPEIRQAVINHGGGHDNHSLFWQIMGPNGGGEPVGLLWDDIKRTFNQFARFQQQFKQAALDRFGSGWAWLVVTPDGKLAIESTPNQDSPLMKGKAPILGIDVWEHAYYLKYQYRRADYVDAWWNVVNWNAVAERYNVARAEK
jgi:Fe-Mn family superoxide dismutase